MAARDFIPREHGAWAMLAQASFMAVLLGPAVRAEHAFLVATAAAVFIARAPVGAIRRRAGDRARIVAWAAVLVGGAATGAVLLALTLPSPLIAAAGLVAAFVVLFNVRRAERSTAAEVTAMLGFALLIPVGVALAGGDWMRHGVSVGALTFLFFASSIPHVRAMVQIRKDARSSAASRERLLSAVGAAVVISAAAVGAVLAFVGWFAVVAASLVALRPVLSTIVVRRAQPIAIRSVGLIELGLSTAFTAVLLVGERP
jgi:hypothetical protein